MSGLQKTKGRYTRSGKSDILSFSQAKLESGDSYNTWFEDINILGLSDFTFGIITRDKAVFLSSISITSLADTVCMSLFDASTFTGVIKTNVNNRNRLSPNTATTEVYDSLTGVSNASVIERSVVINPSGVIPTGLESTTEYGSILNPDTIHTILIENLTGSPERFDITLSFTEVDPSEVGIL